MTYPSVTVGGVAIPFVNSAKNLGIILSPNLTWNEQIAKISSKVNFTLSNLYRNSFCLPEHIKIHLINSLIFPCFDYACLTYNALPDFLESKLVKLQNRCIRFIYSLRKGIELGPYRKKLKWLSPCARRKYFLGLQMYKILEYKRPQYLYSALEPFFSAPIRPLRSSLTQTFSIPKVTNKVYEMSFRIQGMKFWNGLPRQIRNSESVNILKSKLSDHLLQLENRSGRAGKER